MNKKFDLRTMMVAGLVLALAFAFAFTITPAQADSHEDTFKLTVKHRLNGEKIGLDRELCVDVYVNNVKTIPDFCFGDNFRAKLPAGEYFVELFLAGTDTSTGLTLGPVDIAAGAKVTAIAKIGFEGPTIEARVRQPKVKPEPKENVEDTFKLAVKHRLNGEKIGLDRELCVDVYVNNAKTIPDFCYGDTFRGELPAGEYFVELFLAGTDTSTGLTLGPVDIPEGVMVTAIAKIGSDGPTIEARIRQPKMRK